MSGTDIMYIEELLRNQRKKLHLTQAQVAMAAGINLQSYQRLEYGTRSVWKSPFSNVMAICTVLQLDPMEVFHAQRRGVA